MNAGILDKEAITPLVDSLLADYAHQGGAVIGPLANDIASSAKGSGCARLVERWGAWAAGDVIRACLVHINIVDCLNAIHRGGVAVQQSSYAAGGQQLQGESSFYVRGGLADAGKRDTGLGLYICKEIVEKHGGRMWTDSKMGDWVKFSFTLPNWG